MTGDGQTTLTNRRKLWALALDQHGFVTTTDAEEAGIPKIELPKIAARGGLQRISYGLYRFEDMPPTEHDQFAEAVLRVGGDAHLTGDAVLSFHQLGLVNPIRIKVGVGRRYRGEIPPWMEVIQESLPGEDLTDYDGVPSATVKRALLDSARTLMMDRLLDALNDSVTQGWVTRKEAEDVNRELAAVSR